VNARRPQARPPSGASDVAGGAPGPQTAWWLQAHVPHAAGLTTAQALKQLLVDGPNQLAAAPHRGLPARLRKRLRNPLVLILLAASAVSAATGDLVNFAVIAALVLLSVALDLFQEHRADRAAEALKQSVALSATVLRDGRPTEVGVETVVVGDLVQLSAGERVPADGVVVDANDFFVNQALLTGEPYPVEKRPGVPSDEACAAEQAGNAVFMGSSVVSGSATVRVCATGSRALLGGIAAGVQAEPPPTAFEMGIARFGALVMNVTVGLVLFALLANLALGHPTLDAFMFAVALAVGLTPELLPMVVSITLSRGAVRMARHRMIVKRLASIHDLGAMDVLCTDKTGTLTEARMHLDRCIGADGEPNARVLELARLNSAFESGWKNPLDEALMAGAGPQEGWSKVDEVPFDFERRRVSVLLERAGERWLVVKGAPADVLSLCKRYEMDGGRYAVQLDEQGLAQVRGHGHALERQGLRVVAVAWRIVAPDHDHADVRDETDLTFVGFAAFMDPPKPGAGLAISDIAKRGVSVKIVTGDSDLVTQHLCSVLQLPVEGVLTGSEIAAMDDTALQARVDRTTLFCRANPEHKLRVVRALKARGHVVGYMGDGINDAPALRAADIGLTVDSAVDVAREVADIIMLEPGLGALLVGVQEGRRTFGNVMKYIMMGTSSNFGNMLSMAGASLFLPFLPMLPAQILLNNVLYDLSQAIIPLDRVDAQDMERPRQLDIGLIRRAMLQFGAVSSVFDALTFWVLLSVLDAGPQEFRTGWFLESLVSQVLVVFVVRTRGWPWESRPSAAVVAGALIVVATALVLPWTALGRLFDFVPLPALYFAWMVGLLTGYLLLAEWTQRMLQRHGVATRLH
jgi:Mg2+-importing ATPase